MGHLEKEVVLVSQFNTPENWLILIVLSLFACLGLGIGPLLIGWRLKKNGNDGQEAQKYLCQGHVRVAAVGILTVVGVAIWLRYQYGNGWLILIVMILPLIYYMIYWRKRRA